MMILFWSIIALMIILALGVVIWPLFKVNSKALRTHLGTNTQIYNEELAYIESLLKKGEITQETAEILKLEKKKRLLEEAEAHEKTLSAQAIKPSFLSIFVLMLLVPTLSLYLYFNYGDSKALSQFYFEKSHAKAIRQEMQQFKTPQQLIARLKLVLKKHPQSAKGWFLLGQLYNQMQQYSKARIPLSKAVALDSDNLNYKLEFLQADFFSHNKKLSSSAAKLLNEILQKHPDNPEALNLSALNAFSNKQYQLAVNQWQSLLDLFPENNKNRSVILNAIAQAQTRLKEK